MPVLNDPGASAGPQSQATLMGVFHGGGAAKVTELVGLARPGSATQNQVRQNVKVLGIIRFIVIWEGTYGLEQHEP